MAKLKITTKFGVIPNSILNDKTLSAKAKGLWVYLQSKPENWNFSTERIANDFSDGITAIRSGLQELENAGYLIREADRSEGKFNGYDYTLTDEPMLGKPSSENPPTVNPSTENLQDISNIEYSKKEIVKKRENTQAFDFLKKHYKSNLDVFEMQNKKNVERWDDMIQNFNDRMEIEVAQNKISFEPNQLMPRLKQYCRSWISNQKGIVNNVNFGNSKVVGKSNQVNYGD